MFRRMCISAAAVAVVALAGCSEESESVPNDGTPTVYWYTTTDDLTGATFRCFERWEKRGYGGGLAMWCYETEGAR